MRIPILLELIWLPLLSFLQDSFISRDLYQYPVVLHTDNDFNRSIVFTEQMLTLFVISDAAFALKMTRWHQPKGPPAINYWPGKIECGLLHSFFLYNLSYTWRRKLGFAVYCTVYCTEYRTVYCTVYNTICTTVYVYVTANCSIYFTVYDTIYVYCTAYCTIYYSVCCTVYSILQCKLDALFDHCRTAEQIALELKLAKSFKLEFGTAHAAKVSKSLRLKDLAAAQSASSKPANANLQSGKEKQAKRDYFPESFLRCQLDTLFVRWRTAEQLALELKLLKGFSSNIEGDGPLASEVRYVRRKYTPKRRRLSSRHLKRGAENTLDEYLGKRRRICSAYTYSDYEQVRVSKRLLNHATLPAYKFRRYSGQLPVLNLLKRDLPESCHKPPTKRRKIKKLHRKNSKHTSTYHMPASGSQPFKKNRQKTIPPETKESTTSKIPRSHTLENSLIYITVILSLIPALGNNRRKSKKEQLKEGIFPKIND